MVEQISAQPHGKRVLVISSGGGHWVELLRLRPAWQGCEAIYVTTSRMYRADLDAERDIRFHTVPDANRWQKIRLLRQMLNIFLLLMRYRPDVVLSTGAAPGYFAIRFGKWLGARTIWVDSIANAAELSMTGRLVEPYADIWLTQWEHLARPDQPKGPHFHGAVL